MESTLEFDQALDRGCQLINRLELIQYQYFNGRPQWISIKYEDLKLFMAYTYYGSPFKTNEIGTRQVNELNEDDMSINDLFESYKDEEKKCIEDMIQIISEKIIKKKVSDIEVGCTITHSICKMKCDVCQNFPTKDIHQWYLLRIKLSHPAVAYIDLLNKRTYKSWTDYIENNSLPRGYMFFPESGYYEESNYLIQNITPQSKQSKKVLNAVDVLGRAASFTSCIVLSCGLIFPVLAPVVIPSAAVAGSFSAWEAGRQISKLSDLSQHNESLVSKKAGNYWINLAIASLGVITAPMSATVRNLEIANSTVMASNIGKSLSVIQKGACITQCSLEVIRFTTNIIIKKQKLTLNDLMCFRLDVFIVTGSLLPLHLILKVFEYIIGGVSTTSFIKNLDVPFCVNSYFFKAACFVQRQFTEFIKLMKKFLKNQLTVKKLMFCLKDFCEYLHLYKKQLANMNNSDLLTHIVNNSEILSSDELNEVKTILCGSTMKVLLQEKFPNKATNPHFVKFFVTHVMDKARALQAQLNDVLAACETREIININKIKHEFCQVYGLSECNFKDFVLHIILQIADDHTEIIEAYNWYCAQPENQLNALLVANHQDNSCAVHAYTIPSPCNELDQATCSAFAQTIDPSRNEYNNYSFVQPESDVSVLFSVSSFSIKMVIFQSSLNNGIPTLNICFYHDSQRSNNSTLQW